MDFRLKVFATAAKTLNFSTTAQMLGISQSAVSQHIKLLEDKYKVELFTRRGNKYVLTYAGEVLLQKALKILELHNEMEKESELLSHIINGTFIVGIPKAIYYGIFPDFAADYCRLSSTSNIHHKVLDIADIEKDVEATDINVGIKAGANENETDYFFTDTLLTVSHAGVKEDMYYDISEVKAIMYEGDGETTAEILTSMSAAGLSSNSLKIAATMPDPVAAIRFLIEYSKGAPVATEPLVTFLWKSQIAKLLEKNILKTIHLTELEAVPAIRRHYAVCWKKGSNLGGFSAFAKAWAKNRKLR